MASEGVARRIVTTFLVCVLCAVALFVALKAIPAAQRPRLIKPGNHTGTSPTAPPQISPSR
jgi:hypothetical protein